MSYKKFMLKFCLLCFVFVNNIACSHQNTDIASVTSDTNFSLTDGGNIAVVFFSVTSNTRKVAQYVSNHISASLVQIVAKDEYSGDDINYNNSNSRASRENADSSVRPEIENIPDIKDYDTIILCYPIWFGRAPKIVWTFVESSSFENKTVIPICTSASSGAGSSAVDLSNLCKTGKRIDAKRFSSNVSESEVIKYIDNIGFKGNTKLRQ